MKLQTKVIQAENAIGIFLSEKELEKIRKYLKGYSATRTFSSYEEAKIWMLSLIEYNYEYPDISSEMIRPNYIVFKERESQYYPKPRLEAGSCQLNCCRWNYVSREH